MLLEQSVLQYSKVKLYYIAESLQNPCIICVSSYKIYVSLSLSELVLLHLYSVKTISKPLGINVLNSILSVYKMIVVTK